MLDVILIVIINVFYDFFSTLFCIFNKINQPIEINKNYIYLRYKYSHSNRILDIMLVSCKLIRTNFVIFHVTFDIMISCQFIRLKPIFYSVMKNKIDKK